MVSQSVDVAIIGAGASGIYSAWRLANASEEEVAQIRKRIGGAGPLCITVYEMSDRIGGRLLSASPATMPTIPMEMGGMRYLDSQTLVKGLVEHLKVPCHPQDVDEPDNIAYLRGKIFRQSELTLPGVELPYTLLEREKWVLRDKTSPSPAKLIFWAVFQEFPEIDGMQPDDLRAFLRTATLDGKPLWQWGFWNLLSRHLSHEGRQLGITTIGYDVLGANANAVDIIAENFDFTSDSKYHLFDDGFESVIWQLADDFCAKGGVITKNTAFEGFEASSDQVDGTGFDLAFEKHEPVNSRAVVLALPRAAILRLRRSGPLLNGEKLPRVQTMLNAVSGIPLYKLFVVYDTPWWQDQLKLEKGRSLTDLPVRQCYYWATVPGRPSAIMAYNDLDCTSFWGGYQTGPQGPGNTAQPTSVREVPPFVPKGTTEATPASDYAAFRRANWDAHKAPHEMVVEMHRQLMEMHGVTDAPEPIDAAFMDWMNDPFGGAVHFWNPGYKSWEVLYEMTQPVEGLAAFVVGEAYSTNQTWVEGAFQTSEIFLQKRLGMAMPAWVDPKELVLG